MTRNEGLCVSPGGCLLVQLGYLEISPIINTSISHNLFLPFDMDTALKFNDLLTALSRYQVGGNAYDKVRTTRCAFECRKLLPCVAHRHRTGKCRNGEMTLAESVIHDTGIKGDEVTIVTA